MVEAEGRPIRSRGDPRRTGDDASETSRTSRSSSASRRVSPRTVGAGTESRSQSPRRVFRPSSPGPTCVEPGTHTRRARRSITEGSVRWIPNLPQRRMNRQSTRRTELKIEQLSMLATVVVAFAALAALVLTGQAGIRQDVRALQTDMLAGQAELRNEMVAGQTGLRKEMQTGQGELRNEMRAGQAELRKDIRALQVEMRAGQAELRAGQAGLREDLEALGVRLAVVEHRTGCARYPICGGGAADDRMARGRRCPCRRCRFARFARFVRFARIARRTASWGDSFALRSGHTCTTDPGGRVGDPISWAQIRDVPLQRRRAVLTRPGSEISNALPPSIARARRVNDSDSRNRVRAAQRGWFALAAGRGNSKRRPNARHHLRRRTCECPPGDAMRTGRAPAASDHLW